VKDDHLYLIHIMECIQRIEEYTKDGRDDFMDSSMKQDAVIRNFEVIGEAAKRLSPNRRDFYPGVPWRRISGFRDLLIHNYMGVDLNEVWNIVENDLPELKQLIMTIISAI
jgi:uncharacterized protein with HEPN domain